MKDRSDGKATELCPCPKGKGFYVGLKALQTGSVVMQKSGNNFFREAQAHYLSLYIFQAMLWSHLFQVANHEDQVLQQLL